MRGWTPYDTMASATVSLRQLAARMGSCGHAEPARALREALYSLDRARLLFRAETRRSRFLEVRQRRERGAAVRAERQLGVLRAERAAVPVLDAWRARRVA